MVQMWFWFCVGFAYVFLGVSNYYLATRLRSLDVPILPRSRELEEEDAQRSQADIEKELKDGVVSFEDWIRGFNSIRDFVKEFNKSAKTNRRVLCLAALSFFLAAGISFAQGTLSV